VEVEVRLREGVQTLVRAVTFEGNAAVPTRELTDEARLGPGDPLAYGNVEATRTALLALYARRGYLYAAIVQREELTPDRTGAIVRFGIDEGPQVRVGAVVVSGARRTREAVVRESLTLKTGDVYDPESAGRSQAALLRLGVFRSVGLRLADPELPGAVKDVTVQLSERPWRTLSPGVGFSLANGPRAFVELVEPNLLGRALELSVRAKANYPLVAFRQDLEGTPPAERFEGRLDIGLHDPRVHVFGLPAGGRVDGILERLHRPSYDLARASTIFGLDRTVSSHVTLSLQYELEIDHIVRRSDVVAVKTRADVESLRFPEGITTLNSIRPVLTVDYRDDSVHPRKGWVATGVADYSHSLGGGGGELFGIFPGSDVFTHMLRLSGTVSGYLPVGPSVLALSLRGGRVLPLDPASQTIGPKRFFLGGASTMRGYGEDEFIPQDVRGALLDQVRTCAAGGVCTAAAKQLADGQFLPSEGGEVYVNGKLELRFPLSTSVEAGIFTDVGNLWLDPRVGSITDVRWNFGAGLRFLTPIGPAVLDLGVNPAADARLGEAYLSPHFSIGLF
jgi:outer membrane protein assembly factor BamA